MIRALFALLVLATMLFLLVPLSALAQITAETTVAQPSPIIRTELDTTSTVPGQPAVLRVTLLVPTWMPKPPSLPNFDLPNLMVLFPERATLPMSTRINQKTWSGISRTYHLYPIVEGDFHLPAQVVSITYADPDTRAPITFEGRTEAMTISARIPAAARGLDPFVAATRLRLTETIEGDLSNLSAGDAITRHLRVEIEGAAAVMIPPLLPQQALRGLSSYQRDPRLINASERSIQSGVRVEEVTYVVEAGGQFALPAAQLRWFNLKTGAIETARVERVEITAQGPSLSFAKELEYWGENVGRWFLIFVSLTLLVIGIWRFRRQAVAFYEHQRATYFASELYAFWHARRLLKQHRFGAALTETGRWWQLFGSGSQSLPPGLEKAFTTLGSTFYGRNAGATIPSDETWSATRHALQETRRKTRNGRRQLAKGLLPQLNPISRPLSQEKPQ